MNGLKFRITKKRATHFLGSHALEKEWKSSFYEKEEARALYLLLPVNVEMGLFSIFVV